MGEQEKTDYKRLDTWDEDDRAISQMGYFSWRPKFLEVMNKPYTFVLTFGLTSFFSIMAFGILSLIIPTLEVVFNLNSKETGLILMANDLSGVIAAIVMANYCSGRKVRWIVLGTWIVVIAVLIPSSTTLMAEYPKPSPVSGNESSRASQRLPSMCSIINETDAVPRQATVNRMSGNGTGEGLWAVRNHRFYWLHVLGALLQGIGSTPPGIAGSTYMDEIFPQKAFGVAISVLYAVAFVGFPLSMIAGSFYLTFYVTLNPPEGLSPDSKEWIGAWWLGMVIPAGIVFALSWVLALFPRQMPAAKKVLEEKIRRGITTAYEKKTELNRSLKEITKDMIPAFRRLFKNWALNFLIIGDCFLFLQIGSYSFFPKIYSIIYRISPKMIGNILGPSKIISFVVGIVAGGIFIKRKTWKAKRLQLLYSILSLICIPFSFGILMYCESDTYAGVQSAYPVYPHNDTASGSLTAGCNRDCECNTASYEPLCDNGLVYFSPCHAGCRDVVMGEMTGSNGEKRPVVLKYTGCSCTESGEGTPGVCGTQCPGLLWGSIVITSIGTILNFAGFAAHAIIYQRVVSEVDRTMAQGIRQTATRLLGTLPSPLIYGWLLDQTCIVWKKTEDGTVGNCWVYDIDKFMMWFVASTTVLKVLSSVFYFLCWWCYPENVAHTFQEDTAGERIAKVLSYELLPQATANGTVDKGDANGDAASEGTANGDQ